MKIECYTTMQDGVKVYVIREAHEGPGRSKQLSFYVNDKGEFVRCRVRNAKSSASAPSSKRGRGRKDGANAAAVLKSSAAQNTTTASKRRSVGTRTLKIAKSSTRSATAGSHQKKPSPQSRAQKGLKKSA